MAIWPANLTTISYGNYRTRDGLATICYLLKKITHIITIMTVHPFFFPS